MVFQVYRPGPGIYVSLQWPPPCWLLLSIYENRSKAELNFPPVHAFPHPCHHQLASAFGCSIELTDASQHRYLYVLGANRAQNSRFLTEGVFIVFITDFTDWSPCFQCGVWFPWRWSMHSFRAKYSATDAASTQSLLWTPQKCRDSWEVPHSFLVEHSIPLLSTSGWISKRWGGDCTWLCLWRCFPPRVTHIW